MNEQLQEAVAELIEKSLKAFEQGADFLSGQLPDVIQQLLMWHMALSGVKAIGAILAAILLIVVDVVAFKKIKGWGEKNHDNSALPLGWVAMGCFIRVPGWMILVFSLWNLTWLQIWIAPKIFLIEYAARMVAK